jgi:hypothetical protein
MQLTVRDAFPPPPQEVLQAVQSEVCQTQIGHGSRPHPREVAGLERFASRMHRGSSSGKACTASFASSKHVALLVWTPVPPHGTEQLLHISPTVQRYRGQGVVEQF